MTEIVKRPNMIEAAPKPNHFITEYLDCAKLRDGIDYADEANGKTQINLHIKSSEPTEKIKGGIVMLKDFRPRLYQQTILNTAALKNTLVVLPTGMGKTGIAFLLAIQRLNNYPKSKILVFAPTKPLVEQHISTFQKHIENVEHEKFAVFTGSIAPEKRMEQWKTARIIFSTPQGFENDIISRRITLEDVSLVVFDEAHRAVGDYSYSFIAKQYAKQSKYQRILALTASPGSDMEKILEVCRNLFIEDIEIRTEEDPDVKPYIQKVSITWTKVDFPESFQEIRKYLHECFFSKLKEISLLGYLNQQSMRSLSKTEIIQLQAKLHGEIANGNKDFQILKSISLLAEAMKVQHAIELLETQEISSLLKYMEKLQQESVTSKVKAVQNLVSDIRFKAALAKTRVLAEKNEEHPKLIKLKEIAGKTAEKPDTKMIVFSQYRDTAVKIESELNKLDNIKARIFVGQAKKGLTGLSQKKQKELISQFANSEFNVLIATSVGEEGLDIPKVDLVVFYEPIPSAIRHIQRRGRTGRLEEGRVIILTTKGTRDESYRWSAFHKEKRMHRNLNELKRTFKLSKIGENADKQAEGQKEYAENEFTDTNDSFMIIADDRERNSAIIRGLVDSGIRVCLKRLNAGDYMLSLRCGVELKKVPDFVDSIIDGRLLEQLALIKNNFDKPLLVIEGEEDIYSQRKIHPNAIRGMFSTIAIKFGIPIIQTKNSRETAELFKMIAKKEQEDGLKDFEFHNRKPLTLKEQQEYIVSSLPGIGNVLAKPLLERFGSIKNLANASADDLQKIEKIGDKKAKDIQKVLSENYI